MQTFIIPTGQLKLTTKSKGTYQSIADGIEYSYNTNSTVKLTLSDEHIDHELLDYYHGLALSDAVFVSYLEDGEEVLCRASLSGQSITEEHFTKRFSFDATLSINADDALKIKGFTC